MHIQIPSQLLVWDALPLNAMGKVRPSIYYALILFELMTVFACYEFARSTITLYTDFS